MFRAFLLAASTILAACSGGLTIVPPPAPTREVVPRLDAMPEVTLSAAQQTDLNTIRRNAGVSPVTRSAALMRVAEAHANDMRANGYFSHVSRDGSEVGDRVRAGGYQYCVVVENLGRGQSSAAQVLQHWMVSPTHRRNILERSVSQYGLASSGGLWVLVMAAPGCAGGRQVDWR